MKNNNMARFILSKLVAIAVIALGTYFMSAYFNKTLPFGIHNDVLLAMWAFMGAGCIFAAIVQTAGLMLLFKEHIDRFITRLMEEKGW